jgi:hypothetical protein
MPNNWVISVLLVQVNEIEFGLVLSRELEIAGEI